MTVCGESVEGHRPAGSCSAFSVENSPDGCSPRGASNERPSTVKGRLAVLGHDVGDIFVMRKKLALPSCVEFFSPILLLDRHRDTTKTAPQASAAHPTTSKIGLPRKQVAQRGISMQEPRVRSDLVVVGWLRSNGVHHFTAHIHPEHHASIGVARNQALHPTCINLNPPVDL